MKHLLFLLVLALTPGFAQGPLTLEQCYEKARANYPLIKQLDLIDKSSEYNLSNASKAYLPQVSLTAIGGYIINGLPSMIPGAPNDNGKVKFIGVGQFNQTIWDGGATSAQKGVIKANAEAEKAGVEVSLYAVKERINQLYFGILIIREQIKQLDIVRQNLDRNIAKVRQSVENGLAYTSDTDELRVELLKVAQRGDEFNFTEKAYVAMLGLMIGDTLADDIALERPAIEQVPDGNVMRPEMRSFEFQRQAAMQQNAINKAAYMPKVGLLAFGVGISPGATFGTESMQSLALAGLSLSWSTMGLYRSGNNREQVKLNMDRINSQQQTFLLNTKIQLSQQQNEIQKHQAIVAKDNDILILRNSIRAAYELKYKNGICSVNDLIFAVNAEGEAASNKALHEAQLLMTIYNYKTTSGN